MNDSQRYTELKERFKELGIRPFNRSVEQITGRSASYITRVLQGKGGQLFIGQTAKLHLKWLSVFQSIG